MTGILVSKTFVANYGTQLEDVAQRVKLKPAILHLPDDPQARLAQAAHRLAPARKLFDAFAHNLAGSIAGRSQRASIRTGRVVSGVDGHVRGDALRAQPIDVATGVCTQSLLRSTESMPTASRARTDAPAPSGPLAPAPLPNIDLLFP